MADLRLRHLTREQHRELAELLGRAQDALRAAARIVERAGYTDRTLYGMRHIQLRLIDPLREAWEAMPGAYQSPPYQSFGYGPGKR